MANLGDSRLMDLWRHGRRPGLATLTGLLCACGVAFAPSAAAARSVSGTLVGGATWAPAATMLGCTGDPATSFDVAGTYRSNHFGSGTYSGTIFRTSDGLCPSIFTPNGPFGPGPDFSVGGTLTFTGSRGVVVVDVDSTSTAHPAETPQTSGYSLVLSLTITGGTRSFSKTVGALTLVYGSEIDFSSPCPCLPQDNGTLTGSLGAPHTLARSAT